MARVVNVPDHTFTGCPHLTPEQAAERRNVTGALTIPIDESQTLVLCAQCQAHAEARILQRIVSNAARQKLRTMEGFSTRHIQW